MQSMTIQQFEEHISAEYIGCSCVPTTFTEIIEQECAGVRVEAHLRGGLPLIHSTVGEMRAAAAALSVKAISQRPKKAAMMLSTARFLNDLVDTIVAARPSDHGISIAPPPR